MIRMSVPVSKRCVAKLWRKVCKVTRLVKPAALALIGRQRTTPSAQSNLFVPSGKEIDRWPGEPPIGAQNA